MKVRVAVQPPGDVKKPCGVMLHEFKPRQVELTRMPLAGSTAVQVLAVKGPDGHAPVGLP